MTLQEKIAATEATARILVALIESGSGFKHSGNAQVDSKSAADAFKVIYDAVKESNAR